jgi:mannose-6-phosphate isomerase-like protein (cupin superfamily)
VELGAPQARFSDSMTVIDTTNPSEVKKIEKEPFGYILESPLFKGLPLWVARAKMKGDDLHHHNKTTEVYIIVEGEGKIEMDGENHSIKPGSVVIIKPGVKHRIIAENPIDFYVISCPPYDPEDEIREE